MTANDCYELGYILRTHALYGEFSAYLDVDYLEDYEDMTNVFVDIKKQLVSFEVESVRILPNKPKTALIKLKGIDTIEQAQTLGKATLYLPLAALPKLQGTDFYYHEVTNFQVIDVNKGELGTIKTIYSMQHSELIAMDYREKEVLIPINNETILSIDREKKQMNVNLPDGLLEVYLEEEPKNTKKIK